MGSSRSARHERADDALGNRLASEQSLGHRRDIRVRMLDGQIVVREAALSVIGRMLVWPSVLVHVDDVVVGMTVVLVVFVRALARRGVLVMRPWPVMVFAKRPMKGHVNRGENLDAAEPNQAREQSGPADGRSCPPGGPALGAAGCGCHRGARVSGEFDSINRLRYETRARLQSALLTLKVNCNKDSPAGASVPCAWKLSCRNTPIFEVVLPRTPHPKPHRRPNPRPPPRSFGFPIPASSRVQSSRRSGLAPSPSSSTCQSDSSTATGAVRVEASGSVRQAKSSAPHAGIAVANCRHNPVGRPVER